MHFFSLYADWENTYFSLQKASFVVFFCENTEMEIHHVFAFFGTNFLSWNLCFTKCRFILILATHFQILFTYCKIKHTQKKKITNSCLNFSRKFRKSCNCEWYSLINTKWRHKHVFSFIKLKNRALIESIGFNFSMTFYFIRGLKICWKSFRRNCI